MKKILFTGLLGAIVATSCSTANQAQTARVDNYNLKGIWQVTSVDYDKQFKIKPFGEGMDVNCFVGSQWTLIPNNGKGNYMVSSSECPSVQRNFMFNVTKDKQFSFKVIPDGTKAKQTTAGYFMQLENQTATSFDLVQSVSDGSTPITVVYHFQKAN
ncbi:lipocalin family protein [Elizabethkingia sp. JS20170427COW]|uniref:lipocalin family protein n=1 Tax=Elizabethkingia sp. JS20170427COW TaxID=2583851 RepID=UPI0011108B60|nr:lipocalin family protein [Elizabethkingia sp. JS20170427COW]QCX52505.1 hypothetical protein FGE20_01460 [Elizabethkingia sp. JS20170427COW]